MEVTSSVIDEVKDSFLPLKEMAIQSNANAATRHTATSETNVVVFKAMGRKCKIIKPLLLLKTSLFFYYGAYITAIPFIIVLLKQKGITASELALAFTLSPFLQTVVQTITGIVSDKTGRYKLVLIVICTASVIFTNSLLFLPHNTQVSNSHCSINNTNDSIVNCPFNNSIDINCNSNNTEHETYCQNLTEYNCDHNLSCSINLDGLQSELTENVSHTFLVIAASVLLIAQTSLGSTVFRCLDVVAMYLVKTHSSDFGTQRFWSMLGGAIIPILGGYIVQLTSPQYGDKNCSTAIFLFDAYMILMLISSWKLNIKTQPPAKSMNTQAKILLKDVDVLMFLFIIFVAGTTWSFYFSFTPYYLAQLEASALCLGLKSAAEFVVGLPVVLSSKWCIQKMGVKLVLVLSLVSHVLQCLCFSYIVNPWWSIACAIYHIFNYHLMWVAVVTHAHRIAPKDLTATLVTMAGVVHYTIGKGTGSAIGGFIMGKYGGPWAFRTMAMLCGVTAVIYLTFLMLRRRKKIFCLEK